MANATLCARTWKGFTMLHGIDISHWDDIDKPESLPVDFAIVKATEGTGFTDPAFYGFAGNLDGRKPWGAYHFAHTDDARGEARHFWNVVNKYNGRFLPVLDYETADINYPDRWAREFRDEYKRLSGVTPMLYCSASWCRKFGANVADSMPLWVAGYPRDFNSWPNICPPYDIAPWRSCTIWQFASDWRIDGYSGTLDANVAYLDESQWAALCGSGSAPDKTVSDIAREVIDGKWGNGQQRKDALAAAGYDYAAVQAEVNRILGVGQKSISQLADEVIDGKWGNGAIRRAALTGAGYDYDAVQKEVNRRYGI